MIKKILVFFIGIFLVVSNAYSKVVTETVEYKASDGTAMEGFVTYDNDLKKSVPGVLIVSNWMGISDFTKQKAEKIAKMGYIVFAADIYGKGVKPKDAKEAADMSKKYFDDRALLRTRIRAAYDKFASMKGVNPKDIVAAGYCFGGTAALELARSGAPVVGTVSFHGILSTPNPDDAKNIKGKLLVLNGAEDPNVTPAQVTAFKEEMKKGGVDLKFVDYKGAVHAFTDPSAGNDKSKGTAYDAKADQQSWDEFKQFLKKVFKKS